MVQNCIKSSFHNLYNPQSEATRRMHESFSLVMASPADGDKLIKGKCFRGAEKFLMILQKQNIFNIGFKFEPHFWVI